MLRSAIPFTGILTHCYDFLTSPSVDTFIANPNFNPDTNHPVTVFCVHGTADRAGAFFRLAHALLPTAAEHIRGFYLASFEGRLEGNSIEEYAEQLRAKLNAYPDRNVILMGHSRGALVCSWYAETMAGLDAVKVDTVVGICGPYKGSTKAFKWLAWMSASVEEMRTDSEFLATLAHKVRASSHRYLFVGAGLDIIVEGSSWHPYEGALPEGQFLECQDETHVSITSSLQLADWLSAKLKSRRQKNCATAELRRS